MSSNPKQSEIERLKKELAAAREELSRLKGATAHYGDRDLGNLWKELKSGYWEWDVNSEFPLASPAFISILGYKKDGLSDKDFWRKHIFSEDLPKVFEAFERHMNSNGEVPFDVTLRFRHTGGRTVHVWARGKIVNRDKDGAPVRLVGSIVDITELLRDKALSRDFSDRLKLIVAGNQSAIWDWKIHENKLWWSDRHYTLLGYRPGEIDSSYDSLLRHVHPDDVIGWEKAFRDHLDHQVPYKHEFRLVRKDGSTIWVEASGQALFDAEGKPVRMAGGMIDISDRKNLEIELKKQNEVFRQAEDLAKVGAWEMNLEKGVSIVSEELNRLRGLEPGTEYLIKDIIKNDPPETREQVQRSIEKAKRGEAYEHEVQIRTASGDMIWIHAKGVPVFDDNGKVASIRGVVQNVDEQKRRELEFRAIQEKLKERVNLLREAESVAHMGSWRYDIKSGKVIWSDQLYKIHKVPDDYDPNLHRVYENFEDEYRELLEQSVNEAVEHGTPYEHELLMKTYDGDKIWVKVSGFPVRDEKGNITGLMGISQNIHKEKQREQELKRTEYLYSEAARIGKVGAWEVFPDTGEVIWSREIYNILEAPLDLNPTLEKAMQFYSSKSRSDLTNALNRAIEKKEPFNLELELITANKKKVWVKAEGLPVLDDKGNLQVIRGSFHNITDLKNKEIYLERLVEELRETDQLYSEAARIGKVGAWVILKDTREVTWSKEVHNLLDYPLDYIPRLDEGLDLYMPDSREKMTEALEEAFEKGKPFNLELQMKTKKGREIWTRLKASPIYDEDEIIAVRGSFQDITDSKLKELHLEQLNRELQHQRNALLHAEDIAELGSWSYWLEDASFTLSEQMYRIHEVMENQVKDLKPAVEKCYGEYWEEIEHCIKCVLDGKPYKFEALITTFRDNKKWVRVICSPLMSENQEVIGITGIVQDIDDFKRRERELKDVRDQLNKQNFILTEAKRMAKIGSWQWIYEKKKLTWSELLREIYEVPPSFEPSLKHSLQNFYDEETSELLRSSIKDAVENQTSYDFQARIITFTGKRKWVRIKGSPMYDETGKLTGVFGTVQDINDIKEKERQIEKASELVAEQNRKLMDFTQIVSHNLRSHSSNIQTMLNFVKKNNSKEEQQTYYNYIKETADSLENAIQHLNEVVKIQKDVNLQKVEIDITDSLRDALNIVKGDIRLYDVNVETDVKVDKIRYVKAYLDSIFLNLISNAIKYRHPDRQPLIQIRTYRNEERRIVLEVRDNGQGIDLRRHGKKVFGMYKTFHKHPEARGIGLFIIKNQIEALKGKIEVESKFGEGTLFRVTF